MDPRNKPLLTDGPGFDAASAEADFIAMVFSRREVESGNISDALDRLLGISDCAEHVRKFKDGLTLIFSGYENDPRELHQIPEAVAFFRKLNSHWPYWLHFVEKDDVTLGLVFWLLCDMEVVSKKGNLVSCHFKDADDVSRVMQELYMALNALYEANGISERENEAMTERVTNAFLRIVGGG